jgi:threonine/homoserine/homoserine lactone efflux protein
MVLPATFLILAAATLGHPGWENDLASVVTGFGLGIALAGAPGPVQAVLLTETVRGGLARGFRAQAGANVTFGVVLVSLALGLSVLAPSGTALRILKVVGGVFLLWLGVDGFGSQNEIGPNSEHGSGISPAVRGILAVLVNPGAWLFLGTAASSLISTAAHTGGTWSAIAAALALAIGLAVGDSAVVLFGGLGVRRAGERVVLWMHRGLATVLLALGVGLVVSGVVS